jgi:two-component system, OmpR family, KDP operon response regulator KdpE
VSRILFVEDEPRLLRAMRITLRARGYEVRTAVDGRHALSEAAAYPPDLVILDLGLPDMDGVEVITGLRSWTTIPIIVLSGRATGGDKIAALDAGADDYVTKPFAVDELLARMRAVTRRAPGSRPAPVVALGPFQVDFAAKRVTRTADDLTGGQPGPTPEPAGGQPGEDGRAGPAAGEAAGEAVHLTPTEWRLLEALARQPGKLVSQRELIRGVWGPGYPEDSSSPRLYMNRLRRKLEPEPSRPRYLRTEPGMGYRFEP